MNKPKVWINGKFTGEEDAKICIYDRGFLYGDGVFETMRAYAGIIFMLDEHIGRLFAALKILKIKIPYGRGYLKNAVYRSLDINGLKSAYIRITITRGAGVFGIFHKSISEPCIIIAVKEFEGDPDRAYKKGISAVIVDVRQDECSVLRRIKSLNFLNYVIARMQARKKGFDEAILLNTRGEITEAATSNLFLVKNETIVTPSLDSGILPGITRKVILNIARKLSIRVSERKVSPRELISCDEIFLTNSLAEVLPVTKLGAKKIGGGLPGEITKLLHISYQKQVIRNILTLK